MIPNDAPMTIAMLGPFGLRPKGTMLRRALPAARALARRGHRVTVIMPPWHTPAEGGRTWDDAVAGVRLEYVSLAGLGAPGAGHALVAMRMARRALALAPDIVHTFKPKAYAGLADALLHFARRSSGAMSGRPALVVDTDDWEGRGGWNDREPYGRAERWLFARQERWGLVHADAVTVASRALETLAWSLGVPPARVTYLPNAIDPAASAMDASPGSAATLEDVTGAFDDARAIGDAGTAGEAGDARAQLSTAEPPASVPPRPPCLLLYTRFFEFAPARPLDVLARVRGAWPGARLIVAGRGLSGEEQAFLVAARDRGLGEAVDYRGWVEPGDLSSLLAEADVALYPFDDTLINRTKSAFKLLELMDAGLPVVADAVGQNVEVIEDGASGRLVPPGDTEAFARAVCGLLEDAPARNAMGRRARARVRRAFNWNRQVVRLEAAFRHALAHS